jgi:hypothetical protein
MSQTTPGAYGADAFVSDPDNRTSLTRLGGSLGIAACCIGMAIFVIACFGYQAAFALSFLPVIMSGVGFVLSVLGGVFKRGVDETGPLSGIFINLFGLLGGLLLMAVWQDWMIFYRDAAGAM